MTFKSFVHNTILKNCEMSINKFVNYNNCYIDSEIDYVDMKEQNYKVKITVHEFGKYFTKTYYVGGAFDEYANLYDSVIWNNENEVIYMFTKSAREALELPETIEL